jgi:proteasome lid subunit RPN8/RPN11
MIRAFVLPVELQAQLMAEARVAFPRECCGLIAGERRDDAAVAVALHPTRNLAAERDRFEIDPAAQFRLLRALRDTGREIVGCYHSHPNGRAEPSSRDLEGAGEEDFVWLIAALDADAPVAINAFAFDGAGFEALNLVRA